MYKGKKIAFLATGGGGRAIAHAGVLRVCEKLGIEFDFVIGASAGAIAMIYYSQYRNIDMIVEHFRPKEERKYSFEQFNWSKMISFKNFLSPRLRSGLFDLAAGEEFFERTLYTNDFDKLDMPVYVSVTNLSTNAGMLLGTGLYPKVSISKALVASCCIPILFRPVKIDNHYYVDGEIKRAMSIQAAVDLGADIIIVSDMYASTDQDVSNYNIFKIAGKIANMMLEDKSNRAIEFCRHSYPDKQIIMISPATGDISAYSTKSYKRLVVSGYNAAIRAFEKCGEL